MESTEPSCFPSELPLKRTARSTSRSPTVTREHPGAYTQMMRPSVAVVLGAVAVLLPGSGGARSSRADAPRGLWQGPVLAGDRVAWQEEAGAKDSLRLWDAGPRRACRLLERL